MFRLRGSQDLWAGAMFVVFGLTMLWLGRDYAIGTAGDMGPGYLPMILSWGIVILGFVLVVRSLLNGGQAIEPGHWRPIVFVVAAIVAFGYLVERLGLALTALAVCALAMAAYRGTIRWTHAVAVAVALSAGVVVLFVYVLGLPMAVWWSI